MTHPIRLHELTPEVARLKLAESGRLIIPAGTLGVRGPHLPLATDTIILDHLADDLSAQTGVVRSPTIPFGVRGRRRSREDAGVAWVSRKALHRVMNELIADWEEVAGVTDIAVLTAHAAESHQEALSTIRATGLVRVVDIFGFDFGDRLTGGPIHGGELDTSLLLHLRPDLVDRDHPHGAKGDERKGRELYTFILDRLSTLCFPTLT